MSVDNKGFVVLITVLIILFLLSSVLYVLLGHQIIKSIHDGSSLDILNQIAKNRQYFPLHVYLIIADNLFIRFLLFILVIGSYLCLFKKRNLIIKAPTFFIIIFLCIHLTSFNYDIVMKKIMTHDSGNYISTAQHILKGEGFYSTAMDESAHDKLRRTGIRPKPRKFFPYTHGAPLYPLLLAIFMRVFNLVPLAAALLINQILLALSLTFIYSILVENIFKAKMQQLAGLIAMTLLFFWPFNYIFSFVWTDMTYMCLSIVAISFLHKFYCNVEEKKESPLLLLCAIFCSLAQLSRYIGITIIITGLIMIVLKRGLIINKRKISNFITFSIITIIPILLWVVRNKILTGFFKGGNLANSGHNLLQEFLILVKVISKDFFFTNNKYFLGIVLIVAIYLLIYKVKPIATALTDLARKHIVFILYPFIYLVTLLVVTSRVELDLIDTKIVTPIYPFIILNIIFLIHKFLNKEISQKQ